jgi:hypothetical protein
MRPKRATAAGRQTGLAAVKLKNGYLKGYAHARRCRVWGDNSLMFKLTWHASAGLFQARPDNENQHQYDRYSNEAR